MFLFERLTSLFIYIAVLASAVLLIEWKKSNYKAILIFYTIALSIMGFFYVPYKTADLYRINGYLETFSRYSWKQFFNYRIDKDIFAIDLIYYWLISQTGEPRLLPAINAFICYSCIFYIIIRTAQIYNISRKNIALTVLFFMSVGNYIFVISGIRSMLGICLLCFCFFRESIEKKFKLWHILLYLIAGFIHNFVFVLVFIRLIVPILTTRRSLVEKLIYVFFLCALAIVIFYLKPDYIKEVFNRAEGYLTEEIFSYFWNYLAGGFTGIILIIIFYHFRRNIVAKKQLSENCIFFIICLMVSFVFIFEYSIFHRTITYIAPILGLPILMVALQDRERQGKVYLKNNMLLLTTILLLIVCARGSLCSLKFFVL